MTQETVGNVTVDFDGAVDGLLQTRGDKMLFVEDDEGTAHITFDDIGTGRSCGDCTLCCKLVPVPPIRKPAGVKCQHSRAHKGCMIYPTRPEACRLWSCRWLADPLTKGMTRPDRSHYVIDLEYDTVSATNPDTEAKFQLQMIQVWVDPAFPDAHRDPALRAFLLSMAEKWEVGAIIRYSSNRGFLLFAPSFDPKGRWTERHDTQIVPRNELERDILAGFRT